MMDNSIKTPQISHPTDFDISFGKKQWHQHYAIKSQELFMVSVTELYPLAAKITESAVAILDADAIQRFAVLTILNLGPAPLYLQIDDYNTQEELLTVATSAVINNVNKIHSAANANGVQ